jgi:outer membrane lipoprotein SlyB
LFGIVVGWITYRTLRRAQTTAVSDLATVIGALGGASITAIIGNEQGAFYPYCIGLFIGFFAYAIIGSIFKDNRWLGSN